MAEKPHCGTQPSTAPGIAPQRPPPASSAQCAHRGGSRYTRSEDKPKTGRAASWRCPPEIRPEHPETIPFDTPKTTVMCFIAVNCNQFAFSCKGDYTRFGCKLQEEFAKSLHFCFWENENALSVKAAGLASSPFGRGGSASALMERAIHFRSDLARIASPMAVQPRQVQPSLMLSAVRRPLSSTLFTAFSMASASSAMPKE